MRTLILLLFYAILTILAIPLILFCFLLRIRQPLILYGRWALDLSHRILAICVEVHGAELVDKKTPYVFMANHLSILDGPLLFFVIPQFVRVILKKEVYRIPVIGLGMRFVGFVTVDRKGIQSGKKSLYQAAKLMSEKGVSFLIFPEGTRSRSGKIQPFRRGGFFLAMDTQAPIVPISINGTYALMPKRRFFIKKGNVKVIFHPPISVQEFDHNKLPILMDRVRGAIQSGIEEKFLKTGEAHASWG
ncbi:lysophospholipid acyltransferase family protein [Acidobacteriota bacterium]